jgi:hypothetical protein
MIRAPMDMKTPRRTMDQAREGRKDWQASLIGRLCLKPQRDNKSSNCYFIPSCVKYLVHNSTYCSFLFPHVMIDMITVLPWY